jgi:DNA-binding transcriptional MocR family regulator
MTEVWRHRGPQAERAVDVHPRAGVARPPADLASPITTQAVAARLMGTLDEVRGLRRQQLKPRRDLLASLLSERIPDWTFRVPHGGLFLWVKLPSGDAREFAQFAVRHGVVTLPGSTLSADESHTAFLRLPFLAEPETLRRGVRPARHRLAPVPVR